MTQAVRSVSGNTVLQFSILPSFSVGNQLFNPTALWSFGRCECNRVKGKNCSIVVLLLYVHGKHLRSCRDSRIVRSNFSPLGVNPFWSSYVTFGCKQEGTKIVSLQITNNGISIRFMGEKSNIFQKHGLNSLKQLHNQRWKGNICFNARTGFKAIYSHIKRE